MLRVGVVGAGRIAFENYMPVIAACGRASMVAVCTRTALRHGEVQRLYGCPTYTNWEQFVRESMLDIAVICSPASCHSWMADACAQRGVHVLVEKPLACTLEEARKVVASCDAAGVVLGVGYQRRMSLPVVAARDIVQAGLLGPVVLAFSETSWHRPASYYAGRGPSVSTRDGGGALFNQGIHSIDLMGYLLGPADEVVCVTRRVSHDIDAEDTVMAMVRHGSAVVQLSCSTAVGLQEDYRVRLLGARGTLDLGPRGLRLRHEDEATCRTLECTASLKDLIALQFDAMLDAVEFGESSICTGRDALVSMAIALAAYSSCRRHEWVRVERSCVPGERP